MSTNLTEQEFLKHVGSEFQTAVGEQEVKLKLTQVKAYMPHENEQGGMERFSVFFEGPGNIILAQKTYQLQHGKMGEIDLFLVPISGDQNGFRYEAVFNYYVAQQFDKSRQTTVYSHSICAPEHSRPATRHELR